MYRKSCGGGKRKSCQPPSRCTAISALEHMVMWIVRFCAQCSNRFQDSHQKWKTWRVSCRRKFPYLVPKADSIKNNQESIIYDPGSDTQNEFGENCESILAEWRSVCPCTINLMVLCYIVANTRHFQKGQGTTTRVHDDVSRTG